MRHLLKYILLSVVLTVMTGCKEMFIHELDFQRETDPEMLVLLGKESSDYMPILNVTHSYYFDRKDKSYKDNYISDAAVTMRLNGKDYSLEHTSSGKYQCQELLLLQPMDTVEFTVTHPNYAKATARQVLPGIVQSSLASYELQSNYWAVFDLDFEPYQGNADDMIGIKAYAQVVATHLWTQRIDTLKLEYTYSNDIIFAEAQNQSAEGYYGAKTELLYFPASALQQAKRIRCFADRNWTPEPKNMYENVKLIYLQVDVHSCSYDAYLYNKSLYSYRYSFTLPAPSGLPQRDGTIMDEIMDAMAEMLGEQEPRQVYTNVEGGLGCVTGQILCSSHQVIK